MTYLLTGERLDGTAAERAHLRRLLVSFRTDPPPMGLPHVSGRPLPELLDNGTIDSQVFWTDYGIMACRYAQLGIRALLVLGPGGVAVRAGPLKPGAHEGVAEGVAAAAAGYVPGQRGAPVVPGQVEPFRAGRVGQGEHVRRQLG